MNTNDQMPEKMKRFRSPPYPSFDLKKAIERVGQLFAKAQQQQVGVVVLVDAWSMESVSGKVWRSAAALIQYGLLQDSGTGKARKFKITDTARRIIKDANPDSGKRKAALKITALAPMIHKELWDKFGLAEGLADTVLSTYLTTDRADEGEPPYSSAAADEVVQTYRATLVYAGVLASDVVTGEIGDKGESADTGNNSVTAKIGDLVKWTSSGVKQFDARKVEWISDDGSHLRVFGSPTGIPMNEVETVTTPTTPGSHSATPAIKDLPSKSDITVYQVGGRLQITADVDAEGIEKLEGMLVKYKEILKLLD
jgi:hypothetical protein